MNTDSQTWQELLAYLIEDPQEHQRIATALGVHPVTISRWINGVSTPRLQIMRRLPPILPEEFCERFAALVAEEFPDALTLQAAASTVQQEEVPSVPDDFYAHVLHAYQSTPATSHFRSTCDQILKQALEQLDPELAEEVLYLSLDSEEE